MSPPPDGMMSGALEWIELDLPYGPEAGPQARQALREAFAPDVADAVIGAGADADLAFNPSFAEEVLQDVLIVAGELVINAVDHGRPGALGTVRLSWRAHEGRIYLRMLDAGYDPEFTDGLSGQGEPSSLRGRGLFIVDAICEEWSVASDPITETTQVTACLLGCARSS